MKNPKGITLIALVITIIVLLILAGVSIAMLTGQNGILTRANESDLATARAEVVERVNMELSAQLANAMAGEAFDDADSVIEANIGTVDGYTITANVTSTDSYSTTNSVTITVTSTEDSAMNNKSGNVSYNDDDDVWEMNPITLPTT